MVYSICKRKDKQTYCEILQVIKDESRKVGLEFNPSKFLIDFESSMMLSVREILPNSETKGCLFHFNQALYRKIVELKLRDEYINNDSNIGNHLRLIMSLPFVPEHDFMDVFFNILDDCPIDLKTFIKYFIKTYVGKINTNKTKIDYSKALFNIKMWNVYEEVMGNIPRTNNSVESWHSKFTKILGTCSSSIWRFIDSLKDDEADNKAAFIAHSSGQTIIKKAKGKKLLAKEKEIKQMVSDYYVSKNLGETREYLLNLSLKLKILS